MKRIISILSLIIGFGLWADTEKVGQYTWSYRIINGAAEICKDTFPSAISPAPTGHVSIPNMLGGKPVKAIQADAFRNCIGLTSVTISSNVTRIGESAFSGCTSLASVTIPDSVTTIGASAFWGCNDALYDVTSIKYVQLVDGWAVGADPVLSNLFLTGVRGIADSAFRNCVGLKYVVIPYGVTDIGSLVFADCNQLEEVRLPNSVTQIGYGAFSGCRGLDSITIPNSVTNIENSAFFGCCQLASVSMSDRLLRIGGLAFAGCNNLKSITIPNSVMSIGDASFLDCEGLITATIGAGVAIIGKQSFCNCTNLTNVLLPERLESIGDEVFKHCSRLSDVVMPKSAVNLGDSLFCDCNQLKSISIPNGVTNIGVAAFSGCVRLTSVTIPDSVVSIGDYAFNECNSLKSLAIPDGVKRIGRYAFFDCYGLTRFSIPEGVIYVEDGTFSYCSGLTNVIISDTVKAIGDSAFKYCWNLANLAIPDSVTSIGDGAFSHCNSLASVVIPNGVTRIGDGEFSFCESLTNIVISGCVTSIGRAAFWGCRSLADIAIPDSVMSIGERAFSDCGDLLYDTTTIYGVKIVDGWVIQGARSGALNISGVRGIAEAAFSGCSTLTSVTINDAVKSIGNSAFSGCSGLKSIVISNAVNNIGSSAFAGCKLLADITIPNSVSSIGKGAFSGCSKLQSITLPFIGSARGDVGNSSSLVGYIFGEDPYNGGALTIQYFTPTSAVTNFIPATLREVRVMDETEIGYGAFYKCNSLTNVFLSATVECIEESAFYGCTGLKSVDIEDITMWSRVLFGNMHSNPLYYAHKLYLNGVLVTDLEIPSSETYVNAYAFCGCSSFKSITIPRSIKSIGDGAFYDCNGVMKVYVEDFAAWCRIQFGNSSANPLASAHNLYVNGELVKDVAMPDDLIDIRDFVFYGCRSLNSVTIPGSATSIGCYAFGECSGLTSVTIPNCVTNIGSGAFYNCERLEACLLPLGVEYIGSHAFYGCRKLESMVIPPKVSDIAMWTFARCCRLSSVSIPFGVTNIDTRAFYDCAGLTNINIPDSVVNIGECAFSCCTNMQSISLPFLGASRGNDGTYKALLGYIFDNQWYLGAVEQSYKRYSTQTTCYVPSSLKEITLTDETKIGRGALSGCCQLTDVSLPKVMMSIADYSFYECEGLTEIIVPCSVTNIGTKAFYACDNLDCIYVPQGCALDSYAIPQGVAVCQYVDTQAVLLDPAGGTVDKQSVIVNFGTPYGDLPTPHRNGYIFDGWLLNGDVVHQETVVRALDNHTLEAQWRPMLTYTIVDGMATITGASYEFPNLNIPDEIDGYPIVAIGNKAFQYDNWIVSLIIPDSVKTIGKYAFQGCSNLECIKIGGGIISIGSFAFEQCTKLRELMIAEGLESIGLYALSKCGLLEKLMLPTSVTDIQWGAFANNSTLTAAYFPVSLKGKGSAGKFENSPNVTVCYYDGEMPVGAPSRAQAAAWVSNDLAARYAKSGESAADYQNRFEAKFGVDPVAAMAMPTNKKDAHGNDMYVWQDYVAGTDPTDTNSVFTATITMVDGAPVVEWSPKLSAAEESRRSYTVYGKTNLTDKAWHSPTNESSRFFKVKVSLLQRD